MNPFVFCMPRTPKGFTVEFLNCSWCTQHHCATGISGSFWIFKMYHLYMEDMKLIKNVAFLPNTLGPGSWEISHCCLLLEIYSKVKWKPGPERKSPYHWKVHDLIIQSAVCSCVKCQVYFHRPWPRIILNFIVIPEINWIKPILVFMFSWGHQHWIGYDKWRKVSHVCRGGQ